MVVVNKNDALSRPLGEVLRILPMDETAAAEDPIRQILHCVHACIGVFCFVCAGPIPEALGVLTNLTHLDLSSN